MGEKNPNWQNRVMPATVVRVCSNVRAVVNSNPYTDSTALLAKTIPVAAQMFRRPYAAGFTHAADDAEAPRLLVGL